MRDIPEKDYKNMEGLAKKLASRSFSLISADDLLQEGLIAYLKGRAKYNPELNDYYMGYIYRRVEGAMKDHIDKMSIYGASTTRNVLKKPDISTVSIDLVAENYYDSHEDKVIEEVDEDRLYQKFTEYLEDFTDLEKTLLVGYFIEQKSMLKLSNELRINRVRTKELIINCINHLKEVAEKDLGFSVSDEEVDFKVLRHT